MRVHSISVKNYGPFAELSEVRLGTMATIIGKNDAGKSHILLALQQFFSARTRIEPHDIYDGADRGKDSVEFEVAFTDLPTEVMLSDGTSTTLAEERLLDERGFLRLRKSCSLADQSGADKFDMFIIVSDFANDVYANLINCTDRQLDERCKATGVSLTEADGTKLTAEAKRKHLRQKASDSGVTTRSAEVPLSTRSDVWKLIEPLLPEYRLFETDTRLNVGETTFQSQFRPIVRDAVFEPRVAETRTAFTDAIGGALQGEVDTIFEYLQRHTDAFKRLTASPTFAWDKAVSFDIVGEDRHGVQKSLDKRGSGMRRLLMVSYFQYLAEKAGTRDTNLVLAVEEPENCLHPGLQRELAASFRELSSQGVQVIITSHSPVFAGASPIHDLALIVREEGAARAIQPPDPAEVAEQLGIEPADSITGFSACVFVEGPDDILFWNTIATTLKRADHLSADLHDKRIGLLPAGGDNLKHWVNVRALARLNRRFAAIMDSDRTRAHNALSDAKVHRKQEIESQGGDCFICRKREIENYLHMNAIRKFMQQTGRSTYHQQFDDVTDMKKAYGKRVIEAVKYMTADEILERDRYVENGVEHHELKEIVEALLALADGAVPAIPTVPVSATSTR